MASNNISFHQTTNKNGECEFKVKFGRSKSFVYTRHGNFFYLDLYNNKVGKTKFNGICLGLELRNEHVAQTQHPPTGWKNSSAVWVKIPLQEVTNNQSSPDQQSWISLFGNHKTIINRQ